MDIYKNKPWKNWELRFVINKAFQGLVFVSKNSVVSENAARIFQPTIFPFVSKGKYGYTLGRVPQTTVCHHVPTMTYCILGNMDIFLRYSSKDTHILPLIAGEKKPPRGWIFRVPIIDFSIGYCSDITLSASLFFRITSSVTFSVFIYEGMAYNLMFLARVLPAVGKAADVGKMTNGGRD